MCWIYVCHLQPCNFSSWWRRFLECHWWCLNLHTGRWWIPVLCELSISKDSHLARHVLSITNELPLGSGVILYHRCYHLLSLYIIDGTWSSNSQPDVTCQIWIWIRWSGPMHVPQPTPRGSSTFLGIFCWLMIYLFCVTFNSVEIASDYFFLGCRYINFQWQLQLEISHPKDKATADDATKQLINKDLLKFAMQFMQVLNHSGKYSTTQPICQSVTISKSIL